MLIIGLFLGLLMFVSTFVAPVRSDARDQEKTSEPAAIGVCIALRWLVAGALVINFPRISLALFALAGILGFAASGDVPDLAMWGGVALALAVMSSFGYRGKRTPHARRRRTVIGSSNSSSRDTVPSAAATRRG